MGLKECYLNTIVDTKVKHYFNDNYMLCIVSQIWLVSRIAVLIEIAGKKVK